ncbi:MAG: hydantoinase, partial [Planctomycetaceae bacterium]|nr:hydantoinase [Planctomycetaceae bacterium]
MECWEFWIDVGGTFTDCIARSPNGEMLQFKTLSSGVTKGRIDRLEADDRFIDTLRKGEPDGFWIGYELRLLDDTGETVETARVTKFDAANGLLTVENPLSNCTAGDRYELSAGEESPILCVRRMLGLRLGDAIPPISMRLGTTRGTNALLERKGARTAFVTTRGFRDVLLIANQDRPRLFDLAIHKPQPMFVETVEIDERLDAAGNVLRAPDADAVRQQLIDLKKTDVESIAICLLHSFANPAHEELVEQLARDVGFEEISTSSRLSPLIKIVSRGDTTVVDAYLNPVLRAYVGRLRQALSGHPSSLSTPDSRPSALKIMTSAGGLVDADRFVGKDSILSGPAGGVVGFSRVAEAAGFAKSIGFDMGGTSTDVSRFDGKYELEFETQKAGVRVVAPMLAIHTVAAGGGSICQFDGVKLAVGPESSGADPGPACYGRGGPLSVTDINLFLGRIVPSRFPFPLDRAAVRRKLETLCDEIADSPLGHRYTPIELADGFLQIANANMTRAIRRISVAKGYDPADYALVTFGGAGAQHACAIAEAIGIKTVLVHPFAGILSAYGIGLADVRRFGQQSVLKPYSAETLQEIEPLFEELESNALAEVQAEGIADENIGQPLRSLDMRYQGVETTINVPYGDDADSAAQYQQMHQRLYGYVHENRAIEITAARVEVVGRTAATAAETVKPQHRVPEPTETVSTWFGGTEHNTGVFLREHLQAGDGIAGPAIVCEPTSTIVIDPGWKATVTERGEVVIGCEQSLPTASGRTSTGTVPPVAAGGLSTSADPVLLEIFNNLFASIAEQMG